MHSDVVERSRLSLVEEELVSFSLKNDVPRVDGSSGAHQDSKDGIGSENLSSLLLSELLDDGVVSSSLVVPCSVDDLEWSLGSDIDSVKGLVVTLYGTVRLEVLGLVDVEVELGETAKLDLLQHVPLGRNSDGRVSDSLRLLSASDHFGDLSVLTCLLLNPPRRDANPPRA